MSDEHEIAVLDRVAAAGTEDIDIADVALVLASFARPELNLAPYRHHLSEIITAASQALSRDRPRAVTARHVARAIQAALHVQFGYEGDRDRYDDLMNADLAHVIDRKRGLPVALGILYIHAARSLGATAHGINFPGHFLVGIGMADAAVMIDPFHGGRLVEADELEAMLPAKQTLSEEHLAALSDRGTLIRLQNNIAGRTRASGDWARNVMALETLTRLAPDAGAFRYELGAAYAQIDHSLAARAALTQALKLEPEADWAGEARVLLTRLTRSLN